MEQAAIKSGAMGPPDRRSQGPNSTQLENTLPQSDLPTESKGGKTVTSPAHSVNDGQHNRATLVVGGGVDASNGGGGSGGGDGLGTTTLAGGSTVGGTGTRAPADGGLLPSSSDSLEQIYQSTRKWCRTLRRYPNAMEVFISFSRKNPRPQSGILFNQYLSDLTGIMYRRLSTTVEEEVSSTSTRKRSRHSTKRHQMDRKHANKRPQKAPLRRASGVGAGVESHLRTRKGNKLKPNEGDQTKATNSSLGLRFQNYAVLFDTGACSTHAVTL